MIDKFDKHNVNAPYKKLYNKDLFIVVAPVYDIITRVLSFGRDKAWKKMLLAMIPHKEYDHCLDLACGTGDLTFALAKKFPHAIVHGIDLCPVMLTQAQAKHNDVRVYFLCQDMCQLTADNESIDLITGGYALRNAPSLKKALEECHRVLKVGGIAAFLDFSKPSSKMLQAVNIMVLRWWGSFWGFIFHRNTAIYGYLAESLAQYPDRYSLYKLLNTQGFSIVKKRRLFGGMLEIIICQKDGNAIV